MAKRTKDFTIKIGEDKPRVSLRRSAPPNDQAIERAVQEVVPDSKAKKPTEKTAATGAGKAKPAAKAKAKQETVTKKSGPDERELEQLLRNKRLTIDIPFYLHDALREHNFRNRTTTKEIINGYLHSLLKQKDIRR